ncbi:MAG: epoxyqueuosine reductase QueH [Patescibacteria group bacterium]
MKKKFLLHTCCATCAGHVINILKESGFDVTAFLYNPNIHPKDEYIKRMQDIKEYCLKNLVEFIEGIYDSDKWLKLTKGLEQEPEGGERCKVCFRMRLKHTAEYAKKHNFDVFGTTLTISPHKDAGVVNMIGKELENEFKVDFQDDDWKKQDGFKCACELAKNEGFYKQNYCGCVYSKN